MYHTFATTLETRTTEEATAHRNYEDHTQKYAPQSDTVQGILTDMYHTFATTLETRTTEEATAHRNYEDLMHTYAVELATLQKTLAKKEAIKTEAETMLADATQAFSDAEAQLKSDVKFFDATKESCGAKSDEWGARKALRAEELEGISKALEILTSDEAKEMFAKAIKPGFETKDAFLQLDAARDNGAVGRASPARRYCQTRQQRSLGRTRCDLALGREGWCGWPFRAGN
jgi:hypothetical protein